MVEWINLPSGAAVTTKSGIHSGFAASEEESTQVRQSERWRTSASTRYQSVDKKKRKGISA